MHRCFFIALIVQGWSIGFCYAFQIISKPAVFILPKTNTIRVNSRRIQQYPRGIISGGNRWGQSANARQQQYRSQYHHNVLKTTPDDDSNPDHDTSSEPQLRELYPPTVAYHTGTLSVDALHTLYYEVHGPNKTDHDYNNDSSNSTISSNRTALFLHGGPGAGCSPTHARFFDPNQYGTIVLFDQRGAGASTPRGCVWNNTLEALVQDCEALRMHLGIDQWDVVLGGSWGSTLALAYAQDYPTRVASLILRGVCLMRPHEIDWLFHPQGGAAKRNPQAWKAFAAAVGVHDSADQNSNENVRSDEINQGGRQVLHAYYDRLLGNNDTIRWNAARSFMMYEFAVSNLYRVSPDDTDKKDDNRNNNQVEVADANTASTKNNSMPKTNNNNTTRSPKLSPDSVPKSPAVMVSSSSLPLEQWCYQDTQEGNILTPLQEMQRALIPVDRQVEKLTQGIQDLSSNERGNTMSPRPFSMTQQDLEAAQVELSGNGTGLPAMAMLTCFYSVNELYAMGNDRGDRRLASPPRMERVRQAGIPCIAIQGGRDFICPPDTALEIHRLWPEMELRIPLYAGHSMYHPEILSELVKATDRMAAVAGMSSKETPR